jgi:hypothetical protein
MHEYRYYEQIQHYWVPDAAVRVREVDMSSPHILATEAM